MSSFSRLGRHNKAPSAPGLPEFPKTEPERSTALLLFARILAEHFGPDDTLTLAALLRDIVADTMSVSRADAAEAAAAADAESAANSSPTDRGPQPQPTLAN